MSCKDPCALSYRSYVSHVAISSRAESQAYQAIKMACLGMYRRYTYVQQRSKAAAAKADRSLTALPVVMWRFSPGCLRIAQVQAAAGEHGCAERARAPKRIDRRERGRR